MLACVHGTIFGKPVVPPVNMIIASPGCSPSGAEFTGLGGVDVSSWTDGFASTETAMRQLGSFDSRVSSTSITRAPAASLRAHWSLTGRAGSNGTTIRSARDAANKPTTNSALLAARSATRSPGSRPPRVNWPARSSTRRTRSWYAERDAIGGDDERRRARLPVRRHLDQIGDARAREFGAGDRVRRHRRTPSLSFGSTENHAGLPRASSNTDPLPVYNRWLLMGR